ncbi:MAG: hypothetical protein WAV11_03320 [Minisyncoccia bacterium]
MIGPGEIMTVSTIICFILMYYKLSKVPSGQVSQEPLTKVEKIYVWIICLFNPILGGAILYYGWKNRLPAKARKSNMISFWSALIEIIIILIAFFLK